MNTETATEMNETIETTADETTTGALEYADQSDAKPAKRKASKNSIDAYGAKGKTNVLMFDPDDVVLVTDPKNPLYDERVNLPVSDQMVANIMYHGQLQPGRVRKNPETGAIEVEVGRQRVKAMREANRLLKIRGEDTILFAAIVQRPTDDSTRAGIVASENAIRQNETPLGMAKKMARLLDFGKTETDLETIFGIGKASIRNHLALLEATREVRVAVENGSIPVTQALTLSKLDPDAQRSAVKELVESTKGMKGHEKAKKMREVAETVGAGQQQRPRGKKEVAAMRAKLEENCDPEFRAFTLRLVDWFLGGAEPRIPRAK